VGKTRIHDLAAEFGIDSGQLISLLADMGIHVRSHLSAIAADQVALVRARWERDKRRGSATEAKKTTRRRTRKKTAEPEPKRAAAAKRPVRRRRSAAEVAARAAAEEPPQIGVAEPGPTAAPPERLVFQELEPESVEPAVVSDQAAAGALTAETGGSPEVLEPPAEAVEFAAESADVEVALPTEPEADEMAELQPPADAASEVDRYLGWPAQAIAKATSIASPTVRRSPRRTVKRIRQTARGTVNPIMSP